MRNVMASAYIRGSGWLSTPTRVLSARVVSDAAVGAGLVQPQVQCSWLLMLRILTSASALLRCSLPDVVAHILYSSSSDVIVHHVRRGSRGRISLLP